MNELVIERAALPREMLEWLDAQANESMPRVIIYRKENGRYIFQRPGEANPEVMRIARQVADERAELLARLADA